MNHRRSKENNHSGYLAVLQNRWSDFDFRSNFFGVQRLWDSLPVLHKRLLTGLVGFVVVIALVPFPQLSDSSDSDSSVAKPKRIPLALNTQEPQDAVESTESRAIRSSAWVTYTIQNGDTLSKVFRNNDLPIDDLHALVSSEGPDKPLSNIHPGQLIRFKFAKNGKLDILQLEKSDQSVMFFRLSNGGFGRSN
jgi:hypothetical protein